MLREELPDQLRRADIVARLAEQCFRLKAAVGPRMAAAVDVVVDDRCPSAIYGEGPAFDCSAVNNFVVQAIHYWGFGTAVVSSPPRNELARGE